MKKRRFVPRLNAGRMLQSPDLKRMENLNTACSVLPRIIALGRNGQAGRAKLVVLGAFMERNGAKGNFDELYRGAQQIVDNMAEVNFGRNEKFAVHPKSEAAFFGELDVFIKALRRAERAKLWP
jgi:hypothetical protein